MLSALLANTTFMYGYYGIVCVWLYKIPEPTRSLVRAGTTTAVDV